METIHLKSSDPVSQALLKSVARRGVELSWERSEKLQPQDGFLRLGLCCPFDCLHGPCRIDPFGRGPERGICGLDRNAMVAATLYRICRRGLEESYAATAGAGTDIEHLFSGKLEARVSEVLAAHGLPALSKTSLQDVLARPNRASMGYADLLLHTLYVSLLSVGLSGLAGGGSAAPGACRCGFDLVRGEAPCIGVCGTPPAALVEALAEQVAERPDGVRLVSLGPWIPVGEAYLPLACSSGCGELLIGSGAVQLVVGGADSDPAVFQLCAKLGIPVVDGTTGLSVGEIIQTAVSQSKHSSPVEQIGDLPPAREFDVNSADDFAGRLEGLDDNAAVGIICGSDMVQMTLGKIPAELYAALQADNMTLGGWGDACWWIMNGESQPSFSAFDPLTGPAVSVQGLLEAGRFGQLAGICFTGLRQCREFAAAFGLAFLGCRVSVAAPIPILGSRDVCDCLAETAQKSGGELTYFDHPADTKELSAWFAQR